MDTFFLFLLVGVLAQAVDGALGMAYGVISSSVLLALGVPPATASASVHAAEVFTTAASAGSHAWHKNVEWRLLAPLGLVGGFLDAVGGGGWGPTVSSTMVGAGHEPRKAIGTVNTAEFFLTVAVSATFVWALVSGHWEEAGALQNHAAAVGGLVVGGLIAAPFAGLIVKKVPRKALTYAVGFLLLILAAFQGAQLLKLIG